MKVEDINRSVALLSVMQIFYPLGNGLRLSITVIFPRKSFVKVPGEAVMLSATVWLVSEISSPRRALGEILSEDTELSGTACVVRGVAFGFKSPGGLLEP